LPEADVQKSTSMKISAESDRAASGAIPSVQFVHAAK
jgi:hypothetical protein